MLEKALEVLEEKIKTPEDLYKALHHKNYGLGSIVTQKVGHPLAHKAFQLDHKKRTAKVDAISLEHLEKLSAAFLNEGKIDDVVIEKSNHRYAFTHSLWLMHHEAEIPKLPENDLKQMQDKIEAIDTQINRLQTFQENLHENNENITFVRLKKTLSLKRSHLLDMKESLTSRAHQLERKMDEERHKHTPGLKHRESLDLQKPEKPDDQSDGSTSPSTSGSDTLYINILQSPQAGSQPTTSPTSLQLSPFDSAVSPTIEVLPSSSGNQSTLLPNPALPALEEISSPPSGHCRVSDFYDASTPLQSHAPTPLSISRDSGLTDSPYLHGYSSTGTPQRSPADNARVILSPVLPVTTTTSSPPKQKKRQDITIVYGDQREKQPREPQQSPRRVVALPLPDFSSQERHQPELPAPHDLVDEMLEDMLLKTRSNLSICKELQKQHFTSWVGYQGRATLIWLSNYMQDVQDQVVEDTRFSVIRRDFFSSDANTQDWIDLRHSVKVRIMALEKERATSILVNGVYKLAVDQKSDAENRHHLCKHSGRFFTRWGKTKCLKLYEDEFVAARPAPKHSI